MKILNQRKWRIIISLVLAVAAAGFVCVGAPALAESGSGTAAAGGDSAPIAENLKYTTYRGVAITGTLAANDPDGDAVTFIISSVPNKGTVTADENGNFVYTPREGEKGKDSFTYAAVDPSGSISKEASVDITINKQSTKISYSDMKDNSAQYAALLLAEKDVFIGEHLGNEYFFRPDETVSRGEFLAMCLKINDTATLPDISRTGFSDDSSIPQWAKPYVSTGLMSGLITGYKDGGGNLVFSSETPITYSEAAVILNKTLGISDVTSVAAIDSGVVPAWADQSVANLRSCNILPTNFTGLSEKPVTRAEAAKMLAASIDLLGKRTSPSLFSWAGR